MPTSKRQVGGDYYARMRIQPWDAMEEWLTADQMRGYLLGSAIAYLARFNVKELGKGGIIDVCKAQHFLDHLVELAAEHCFDEDDRDDQSEIQPGSNPDGCWTPELGSENEAEADHEPHADAVVGEVVDDLKNLAESYARRGFKSSEIADRLNRCGFRQPNGEHWTAYQMAMMIANANHQADPEDIAD